MIIQKQYCVKDLLLVPSLRGRAEVVAGHAGLDRPVRWVHVSELLDIARLLNGGEFLLTTGMLLAKASPDQQESYVKDLATQGAAGLAIELVQWMKDIPDPIRQACDRFSMPLVAVREEVRFSTITEEVARDLLHRDAEALREVEDAMAAIMASALSGADLKALVEMAEKRLHVPVVVVSREGAVTASPRRLLTPALVGQLQTATDHALKGTTDRLYLTLPLPTETKPLSFPGDAGSSDTPMLYADDMILAGSVVHVRRRPVGTAWVGGKPADSVNPALLAERLAMCVSVALVDRAPQTYALPGVQKDAEDAVDSLLAPDAPESLVRRRLFSLGVVPGRWVVVTVLRVGRLARNRSRSGGVPSEPPVVLSSGTQDFPEIGGYVQWLHESLRHRLPSADRAHMTEPVRLAVASVRVDSVRAVCTGDDRRALTERLHTVITELQSDTQAHFGNEIAIFAGIGRPRSQLTDLYASYREALVVCEQQVTGRLARTTFSYEDLSVYELLEAVPVERLRALVERELGPILAQPVRRRDTLITTLRALTDANFNVTMAARSLYMRRQSVYRQMQVLDELLGVRRQSPDRRTALLLALRAWDFLKAESSAVRDSR